MIVGNKYDLRMQKSVLSDRDKEEIDRYKNVDVSAMTNLGVQEIFADIIRSLSEDPLLK